MGRFVSIISKYMLLLYLLIGGLCLNLQSQTYNYQIVFRTSLTGTKSGNISSTGAAFHQLTWTGLGTISGCSVKVDSSADGVTWNNGDIIAAQTCTSNGQTISISHVVNFIRINVTTLTGTAETLNAILTGYINSPSGGGSTVGGIAFSTAGGTAPSPVGTSTCPSGSNPSGWTQNNAGTYQTQFGVDPTQVNNGKAGFGSPGFLVVCRPIVFNTTGVANPAGTRNGTAFNVYALFDQSTTDGLAIQGEYINSVSDNQTYTTGNLNYHYAELEINGTPTLSAVTFLATERRRMDDNKTGGSKPRVWSVWQGDTQKTQNYDITNCTGGINGFSNGPCYSIFYGQQGAALPIAEDETGVSYDVYSGGTADSGNKATNATGNVFHALIQASTGNQFAFTNGFTSEDMGTNTNHRNFLSKGTSTSGIAEFQGPFIFGAGGITSYKSLTTAGLGIPVIVGNSVLSSQTGNLGPTTLVTTGSSVASYVIRASVICTTATSTATVALTINYTDASNTAQSIAPAAAACTTLGPNSHVDILTPIEVKNATNITYSTTVANSPGGYRVSAQVAQYTSN
jgi:hypothetical protein